MSKSIITFTYSATKLLLRPCKEVFGPKFFNGKKGRRTLYSAIYKKQADRGD